MADASLAGRTVQASSSPLIRPPLRRTVTWTALANAVYLGSQYGMLMALAKLGNAAMVGEFSLGLAIVSPFIVLSQMQLRQVFVTDVRESVPFAAFFWTRAVSGVLAVLASVALVLILGYGSAFLLVVTFLGGAKLFESQSDIMYAHLQRHERLHAVALSLVVRGVVGLAAVVAVVWMTGSLVAAALSLAAVGALAFLVIDLPLVRRAQQAPILRWRWQPAVVRQIVRISAPLTAASFLAALATSVPRYFLEYYRGTPAVALFAVAMMPISFMGLFTGALSQATLARAAAYLHERLFAAFRSLALKLTLINVLLGTAIVLALAGAGQLIVRLLFTAEYAAAVPLMVILAAAVALNGLSAFGSVVVTAGRQFRLQLLTVLIGLGVQLPACLLLVPRLGAAGAAWAELARFVISGAFIQLVGLRVYRRALSSPA